MAIPGEGAAGAAGERPPYSYAALIAMAIQESPEQRLPVRAIYGAIAQRFPYYRLSQKGWQNSVRHNLSLHACFQKVPRRRGGPGADSRGSDWRLHPACPPGPFEPGQPRRRRPPRGAPTAPEPPTTTTAPPDGAPYRQPPPPPYYLPAPPQPSPPYLAAQPPPCPAGTGAPLDGYGAQPHLLLPGGAAASWSPLAAAAAAAFPPPPPDVLLVPCWDWPQRQPARLPPPH